MKESYSIMRGICKPIAFIVSLMLVCTLFLSACGSGSGNKTVLAKVGDAEIAEDLVNGLSAFLAYYNYGVELTTLPENEQQVWKNQVLVYLCVESEIVKEHLKAEKIELDEAAEASVASNVDSIYTAFEGIEDTLDGMGVRKSDVEYFFEWQAYSSLYYEEVTKANPATDAEIEAYYEENKASLISPAAVKVSHILMTDAEHGDTTRAAIEDVLSQLNDGADFAELAKTYSDDSSAESGGDVGWVNADTNFVQPFKEAALALTTVGAISGVVESEFGFHIIQATDVTPESQKTIDDAREEITSYIESDHYYEAFEKLKSEAKVEYFVDVDPETGEPPMTIPPAEEEAPAAVEEPAAGEENEESESADGGETSEDAETEE
jgi:parvulin-like peptidyl-prolyl isomerase